LTKYEAMFLVDTSRANREWDEVVKHIHGLIKRNGGEISKSEKWAERRLAYPILGRKRATYILVHFEGDGSGIASLQRDCQLSEVVLRVLIVRDERGAAALAEQPEAKPSAEAQTAQETETAGPEPLPESPTAADAPDTPDAEPATPPAPDDEDAQTEAETKKPHHRRGAERRHGG